MRTALFFAATMTAAALTGCNSSNPTPATPIGANNSTAGRSVADLQAEYDRLWNAHEKKCRYASQAEIKANQAVCDSERKSLAPLGDALYEAKLKEAQRQTNP